MEASSSSGPSRSGEPPRSPISGGGIDGPEQLESYRLMSWLSALLVMVVALILPFFFQESSFAYLMDFVSNMRSAGTRLALMPLAMAEFVVQQWEILQSPQVQVEVLAVVGVLLQFLQFIFSRVRSRTKHWSVQCGAWVAYYMPVPHATYAMGMMQHLLYPYCIMALFFAVGLTDAMSAYTLHDSKQSMRRFAQLVLTFCYLVRFVVAFLGALFYRSTSDWHLEAISAALGLVVLFMSLRIHRMASPSPDLGKIVADHMESETKIRREYDPVTWKGYKYIVSAGSLESYDTAMSGCTYLDDIGELNCSSTLKDFCLSSALFHLLVRRYYMLDCAEANLPQTIDFVFKGLITDDVYCQRAFRVVELQLSFLHDYFYAAHSYLSSTSHLIYSILKASFLLSIICLDLSIATGTEETTAADGRARSIGAIISSAALLLLELLRLVSYFLSGWYAVSYTCHLAKDPSRNRSKFSEWYMTHHNTISRSAPFYKVGQYSLIDDLDCKTMKQRLMGLLGRPQRGTPGSSVVLSGRIIDDILNVIISISRGISKGARSPLEQEELQAHCGEPEIHRILRWHIATWCCDRKAGSQETYYPRYKAVQLSRYCAYLVAFHPELLPVKRNDALFIFDGVVRHLKEAKLNLQGATSNIDWDQRMVNWLLGLSLEETWTQTSTSESMVILRSSGQLAKHLLDISDDNTRWKLMEDFWVRMMVFLVPSRNAAAHIEYLAKGREFMTHLWALLSNAGILAWELHDEQSVATKTGDKAASSMKASAEVTKAKIQRSMKINRTCFGGSRTRLIL